MGIKVFDWRRQLNPFGATVAGHGVFLIPRHPQSAISLERITFTTRAALGFVANDVLCAKIVLNASNNVPIINNVPDGVILVSGLWLYLGSNFPSGESLNPPGSPGWEFSPSVRLAPNDDPVYVVLQDETTPVTGANMQAIQVIATGWEIPTPDLATFPPPDSVEAVV